ncbi:MAG: hypothetical protein V4466_15370, partial [Pseudomonadota bacterium]
MSPFLCPDVAHGLDDGAVAGVSGDHQNGPTLAFLDHRQHRHQGAGRRAVLGVLGADSLGQQLQVHAGREDDRPLAGL